MIKKILIGLAALIVLVIAVAAVLVFVSPTAYRVERQVVINKPKADVYNYVKLLKNQEAWGPWMKRDPAMKKDSKGTDGEPGYVYSWDSTDSNVGAGEQEIVRLDGSRIDTVLRFKRPFESTSDSYITLEETAPAQTRVTWGFSGAMPKPLNLMLLFSDMDKMVGKDFDEGLANLKSIVESRP